MSDMLQITTPIAPKNYNLSTRPVVQNDQVFDLVDLSKVIKTSDRTELYKQQDSTFEESNGIIPKLPMLISKDPSLTASSLKSMLGTDVMTQLSESGNTELLEKLNSFASEVILSPEQLVNDILSQQGKISMFNGQFFDLLKQINSQTINGDIKNAVQALLKSLVNASNGQEILNSLSANFSYLSEQLSASKNLSANLKELALMFSSSDASANFAQLKGQALNILNEVNYSLLLTDKLKNMLPLITYNLSRYNPNGAALKENFSNLLGLLSNPDLKNALSNTFESYIESSSLPDDIKAMLIKGGAADAMKSLSDEIAKAAADNSKTINAYALKLNLSKMSSEDGLNSLKNVLMQVLPKSAEGNVSSLINNFTENKDLNALLGRLSNILNSIESMDVKIPLAQKLNEVLSNLAKQEGINYKPPTSMDNLVTFLSKNINDNALRSLTSFSQSEMMASLLTAPGVFTPLSHFLVPLEYESTRAFGELWVENGSENSENGDSSNHLFLSFSVENVGDFELELVTKNTDISVSLLCPPDLAKSFAKMKNNIARYATSCGYSPKNTIIGPLVEKRMLTDVFPKINEKRSGLNVRV